MRAHSTSSPDPSEAKFNSSPDPNLNARALIRRWWKRARARLMSGGLVGNGQDAVDDDGPGGAVERGGADVELGLGAHHHRGRAPGVGVGVGVGVRQELGLGLDGD